MKHITYKLPMYILQKDVDAVLKTLNKIDIIEATMITKKGLRNRELDIECSEIMTAEDTFHLGILVGQSLAISMSQ